MTNAPKYVYSFGDGKADGSAQDKGLLGGKGANLAEMTSLGMPVPPGFTISTEACLAYGKRGQKMPEGLDAEVNEALALLEKRRGKKFGDDSDPLLVSVRSGAKISMPGMMDTVLNLGLNERSVLGLAKSTGNERFAYDAYRRFIQMYGDVVLGVPDEPFEEILTAARKDAGVASDFELSATVMKEVCQRFKKVVVEHTGQSFPEEPREQLEFAIGAVFDSWDNKRARDYRKANDIPDDMGTAVNVQAMVFGNMGMDCATGVAFTRNPGTGAKVFYGEWLPNAQGEDVVAGIRTPQPINDKSSGEGETLASYMPEIYEQLVGIYQKLESHYRDMQDIEFTIERNTLFMLQTRSGKRNATAEVRIATEMVAEGLIDKAEAVRRVRTDSLEILLHPRLDPKAPKDIIAKGLGASPGAAAGKIVFSSEAAEEWAAKGEKVILVRPETSPDDVHGMLSAQGILTARGGMTSHAAVVARGMSKPCIAGCSALVIDTAAKTMAVGGQTLKEGDLITIDGGEGTVMLGLVPTIDAAASPELNKFMGWIDEFRRLGVRTNADTPHDAAVAREFGAEGIGLCRTEHMFFEEGRILAVQEMIFADDEAGRRKALEKIRPMQQGDFFGIFKAMDGLPVTIRLLDPPLHEFLPHTDGEKKALANALGVSVADIEAKSKALAEVNPMLGHRGCRLGITFPELYEMQARAIIEAACLAAREGVDVKPEIMIPLIAHVTELKILRELTIEAANTVLGEYPDVEVSYLVGTMIELPRAALTADQVASQADFFSFGTNDLTQTTFGISRDDGGKFLPEYVSKGILPIDPFVSIDPGVGKLVKMGRDLGRQTNPKLKVGICGEHGGEPKSVHFCHQIGLDYVSCSPYRVPVARLAAAHAALAEAKGE